MLIRPSNGVMTRAVLGGVLILALLAALAVGLLPGGLLQAQDSTTVEYAENGTGLVLTLSTGDPEDATPITWSLVTVIETPTAQMVGGTALTDPDIADFGDFKIDPRSGVLEFKSPPNFEDPDGGQLEADEDDPGNGSNTYKVVVQATDGDAGATPEDTRSWFKVIVNVSDMEEPGKIALRPTGQLGNAAGDPDPTLLQPQVGVGITAEDLMDGDGGVTGATYQWYRASSRSEPGTAIPNAMNAAYTPAHLAGGVSDIGKYLRLVATYTDERGSGKTAEAVSLYPTIRAIRDNKAPSFRDGDETERGVRETKEKGVNIGFPVTATDPESAADEKLTYWLSDAASESPSNPDTAEGATVTAMFSIDAATGQLKTKDELNRETEDKYRVTVNVTDSSGTECTADTDTDNCDEIIVTIEVLELDEKPTVGGVSTIEHVEGTTVLDTDLSDNDLDPVTNNPPDPAVGPNAAVYTAYDPEGGTVTFSLGGADKDLFELGDGPATCPDITPAPPTGVTTTCKILEFKEKPDFEDPMDSNGDNVYEVTVQASDDANMGTKAVTVKVTNRQEDGKVKVTPAQPRIGIPVTAELTDSDIVAYGPMWNWQRRMLAENEAESCADAASPVWMGIRDATSATYTPHAEDLDYCLRAVAMYNDGFHQQGVEGSTPSTTGIYLDTTPTRPNRFDKTANMALSAVQYPSVNLPPEFGSASTKRFVPENAAVGNDVGEPVTAVDPNGAHTLAGYSLSGADQDSFQVNAATGQLITGMKFNHEPKPKYTVTVTATDTDEATDSITVDIYVIDVDEKAPIMREGDQTTGTIPYDENSTDVVLTLSAGDPEDATPITWSLVTAIETPTAQMVGGTALTDPDIADFGDFKIDPRSGVLEFKSPPNFEDPDGGQLEADEDDPGNGSNTYKVVVQATDGDAGATPEDTRSWFKVIVNVSDMEEPGKIALRPTGQLGNAAGDPDPTLLQPQVGVGITAEDLMDGDGGVTGATYQWYRTSSRSAKGTAISSTEAGSTGTDAAYTPVHVEGASDIDKYLRLVATYTDERGSAKTAEAVSLYLTIRAITDNEAPSFTDGDETERGVRETKEKGVNIGFPVTATDPEGTADEKLTYWLSDAASESPSNPDTAEGATVTAMFSIDAATGQLKTKDELNRETEDKYRVTVNVTDSSGTECTADTDTDNCDEIIVTIEVLELDEKPTVGGVSTIEHVEGTTVLDTDLSDNDLDPVTNNPPDPAVGPNAAVYTAYDPEGGTVTFSLGGADKDLFELGDGPATCPDITPAPPTGVTTTCKILEFKEKPDFEDPMDSNGDNVYEVTVQASDDANMGTKAVTVKVTNRQEDGKVKVTPAQPRIGIPVTAELTDSDIVAYGPMWNWQRRMLAENEAESCADAASPVWMGIRDATSATYTPHAEDLDYCLRAVAMYNDGFHQQGVEGSTPSTTGIYLDTTPTRPNRFDKTANMALSAVQYPSVNLPPEFGSASTKRFVPENAAVGNDVGEPVTAVDPNGAHTVAGYSLSGADQDSFQVNAATGQLITGMKFNHEPKPKYTVTVTATDTDEATDSITVDIYVIDVDEKPPIMEGGLSISGQTSVSYAEGGMDDVETYTASGPDAAMATWSLSGDDAGDFTFQGGVLSFKSSPNYEDPADADTNNVYMVTMVAEDTMDNMASKDVMVTVTNVDDPGTVTLSTMRAAVDTEITATVDDPDGMVSGESWQWERSMDGTDFGRITGETSDSYTPVAEDDGGYYLRATVRYTDGEGSGKSAESEKTSNKVAAADDTDTLLAEYDPDDDGVIERADMRRAVTNFFGPSPTLTTAEMRRLVGIFFS